MIRIESLLSARQFLAPQVVGQRIYFASNSSGRLSLYAMDFGGSIPEPLLPPDIALPNPHVMSGGLFTVLPNLGQILVMIDQDGDENYQPMLIPLDGGFPEPAFGDTFANCRVHLIHYDLQSDTVYFWVEKRTESLSMAYRANMSGRELLKLGESRYGCFPIGANENHSQVLVGDAFGAGDMVVYWLEPGQAERHLLYGTPLEQRQPGQKVVPNSIGGCYFVANDQAILCTNSVFEDCYGLGLIEFARPGQMKPVTIVGQQHRGLGELDRLEHLTGDRYLVGYNIDGCSWLYEGRFDPAGSTMNLEYVLCGQGIIANGVLEACRYDKAGDCYALSYSTATSPTQIYTISGLKRDKVIQHTREKVLGIPAGWLSAGEDASFISFDGLRVSARLYLPAAELGYTGRRPLVYYIHGGPQSQERPDFAWFSMPLIQYLTIQGFAVFVPNVRGSTGYGFDYMNRVVRDWGGQDRFDHYQAMTEVLPQDERIDSGRVAVMGRSYGGFMTLTLAGRFPNLWKAAIDMFGPYDLITFGSRVPESWKPYMAFLVGDPETEQEFLAERSPRTYIHNISCPLLVIQGKNDPRVLEVESRTVVEELRQMGKNVDYLMFEDEGHDMVKLESKIRCYNAIVDFFKQHLA